jgi:hypothetical protein
LPWKATAARRSWRAQARCFRALNTPGSLSWTRGGACTTFSALVCSERCPASWDLFRKAHPVGRYQKRPGCVRVCLIKRGLLPEPASGGDSELGKGCEKLPKRDPIVSFLRKTKTMGPTTHRVGRLKKREGSIQPDYFSNAVYRRARMQHRPCWSGVTVRSGDTCREGCTSERESDGIVANRRRLNSGQRVPAGNPSRTAWATTGKREPRQVLPECSAGAVRIAITAQP